MRAGATRAVGVVMTLTLRQQSEKLIYNYTTHELSSDYSLLGCTFSGCSRTHSATPRLIDSERLAGVDRWSGSSVFDSMVLVEHGFEPNP